MEIKKGHTLFVNEIPFLFLQDIPIDEVKKKKKEIFVIASFLEYAQQKTNIKGPIYVDESPDFHFDTQSDKIAVELCQFFCDHNNKMGSKKKRLFQYKEEIMEETKKKFEENCSDKLLVRISWNEGSHFKKNSIIDELYTFIRAIINTFDTSYYFSVDQLDMNAFSKFKSDFPSLFSSIISISINKLTCHVPKWDFIEFDWLNDHSNAIIDLIKKKENLLNFYKQKKPNHNIWLLIHSNSRFIHETIYFPKLYDSTMVSRLQTNFSSIYLFDTFTHQSLKIPIS